MSLQEVNPNSPADLAGLKTETDYIIGADSVLHEVCIYMYIKIKVYFGKAQTLINYSKTEEILKTVKQS